MSQTTKKPTVFVLRGEAKDQETIIRQRSWYEDELRAMGKVFSKTKLYWQMNKKGNFSFQLDCYA